MRDVVVVDSVRTGLAKSFRGSFNQTRSDDMLAHLIDSLLDRNPNVSPDEVEDVVVGAASHSGEQDGNLARLAVVLSKLPITTAGLTINRFCSSGLQSIAIAANQIASGNTQVAIAGGVDSISMRTRQEPGKSKQNQRLLEEKPDIFMAMGTTAEVVARRYQVTREMQDVYALQSQQRYARAAEAGWMAEEMSPMPATMLKTDRQTGEESQADVLVDRDECNRPTTTLDGLSALAPAFEEDGTVTAGNASQLSDGASMTLLMTADRAAQLGIQPMGIYRGFTVAACEPDEMGIGPVFAIPRTARERRHQAGRRRPVGTERSVRLAVRLLPRPARHRQREVQRQRRQHRDRTSVRHDGFPADGIGSARAEATQPALWRCHDVHRRRPGSRWTVRGRLTGQ